MSSFAVKVERIVSIEPHPNADRLELVQVLDWRCVVQKGAFKAGDLCVYFPIDSILPQELEEKIFGLESKVKLNKHRVRTIKLRGAISQGLVVAPETILPRTSFAEGYDLTTTLGVIKHEPPQPGIQMQGKAKSIKATNPNFDKYTSIENAKNYPSLFSPDELVVVTEKVHGTNFRAGWVKSHDNTFWKRVLRVFRLRPEYEFVYGSHNVQLQERTKHNKRPTWHETNSGAPNVYEEAVENYDLRNVLPKNVVVYGEVYGSNIQKGYTYGCAEGERRLVIFDVKVDGDYLSHDEFARFIRLNDLKSLAAPLLFLGEFKGIPWNLFGPSVLAPSQTVNEGYVVKPLVETRNSLIGRKILKFINPEYLLKDQTEFH
jgi:RNA ligase (TIGR02306 family)